MPKATRTASHTLLVLILVSALPWVAECQELTNHALGKAYELSTEPGTRYADAGGPETYVAGAPYRGELTDGVEGPASYGDARWVGWRNTSYVDPISITMDLEKPTWIDRIEITCCGGAASIEPPERIDVSILSPDSGIPAFVQVARVASDREYRPGEDRVYRFVMEDCGFTATKVRLDCQERTWQYLFIDEIRILGGKPGTQAILPVQDVTIEAEDIDHALSATGDAEAVSGKAVTLDDPSQVVEFSASIPAGDYTVRVRSRAIQPDTFNELAITASGESCRPQPVTNSVLTWQRSHFSHAQDGPVKLALSLAEGSGVMVDQIRLHRMTLGEPIQELRPYKPDTPLAGGGKPLCIVVPGDDGRFSELAAQVVSVIEKRCGAKPEIRLPEDVTEEHLLSLNVIALGDRTTNFAILKAAPNAWNSIPGAPEDGGPQVYTAVDVRGTDTNVVVLGGADDAQVAKSAAEFARLLTPEGLPYTRLPEPALTMDRERFRELAVESGQWIRQGAIRTLMNQWKAHTDDVFVLLAYRYLEYKDSYDTIRQVSRDGFIEAELFKILCRFDRSEHDGLITDLERLQLTNTLLAMAQQCEGIFIWDCCGRKHRPADEAASILEQMKPTVANNHQTFPMYSIATAGEYFDRCYKLPQAAMWLRWADLFMQGQMLTSKPQCDCWGYQDITMTHTARYAAMTGRWGYFESEPLHQFLRLRFMSYDNLGAGVGYGDVGAYGPALGPDFREDNAANWNSAYGGRLDLSRVSAEQVLGVYVHPLEPMWYEFNGAGALVPGDKCFDKISFRDAIDPSQGYLLLDGLCRGYHGHWDGNSILRFTSNERMWLCEGDYLKGDPKDHNTMTFMRNGESGRPGMFSSLESMFEAPDWGMVDTRTPDYCGLDWDRHIMWHRPSDTFVLIDEMTARESGAYDMKSRFRSLGDVSLEGDLWTVRQQGEKRFRLHAPGEGHLALATVPEDAKNWQQYEFAEAVPQVLTRQLVRNMTEGDSAALPCVFYARDEDGNDAEVSRLAEGAMVISGPLEAIVGVRGLDEPVRVRAAQYIIGPDEIVLVNGTNLDAGGPIFEASGPVSIQLDLAGGKGVIEASSPVSVKLWGITGELLIGDTPAQVAADGCATFDLAAGRHEISAGMSAADRLGDAFRSALQMAAGTGQSQQAAKPAHGMTEAFKLTLPATVSTLATGDLDADGRVEFIAGCEDGTVAAVDAGGKEIWRRTLGAKVNDIATVDLNGDGQAEVVCGVEDEHLYVLNPDGSELWKKYFEAYRSEGGGEGHVRVVMAADFDGDDLPEIACGCANTMFYVLDSEGNLKRTQNTDWQVATKHSASAINAADVTGDGQLDLLVGFTYFGRHIVDFSDTGRTRVSNLGGCISGCEAITSADVDADGRPEAVFGDRDGQLTACKKAKPGESTVQIVWQKLIGDDVICKTLAGDLDGDGEAEIAIASHSGFLALLNAQADVQWIRYAENRVTDAALLKLAGDAYAIARSSTDGSVVVYDPAGKDLGRWYPGEPIALLAADTNAGGTTILAAGAGNLYGARYTGQ